MYKYNYLVYNESMGLADSDVKTSPWILNGRVQRVFIINTRDLHGARPRLRRRIVYS